jgi:hypothetical protein
VLILKTNPWRSVQIVREAALLHQCRCCPPRFPKGVTHAMRKDNAQQKPHRSPAISLFKLLPQVVFSPHIFVALRGLALLACLAFVLLVLCCVAVMVAVALGLALACVVVLRKRLRLHVSLCLSMPCRPRRDVSFCFVLRKRLRLHVSLCLSMPCRLGLRLHVSLCLSMPCRPKITITSIPEPEP